MESNAVSLDYWTNVYDQSRREAVPPNTTNANPNGIPSTDVPVTTITVKTTPPRRDLEMPPIEMRTRSDFSVELLNFIPDDISTIQGSLDGHSIVFVYPTSGTKPSQELQPQDQPRPQKLLDIGYGSDATDTKRNDPTQPAKSEKAVVNTSMTDSSKTKDEEEPYSKERQQQLKRSSSNSPFFVRLVICSLVLGTLILATIGVLAYILYGMRQSSRIEEDGSSYDDSNSNNHHRSDSSWWEDVFQP